MDPVPFFLPARIECSPRGRSVGEGPIMSYGTTDDGGKEGVGMVFQLAPPR